MSDLPRSRNCCADEDDELSDLEDGGDDLLCLEKDHPINQLQSNHQSMINFRSAEVAESNHGYHSSITNSNQRLLPYRQHDYKFRNLRSRKYVPFLKRI